MYISKTNFIQLDTSKMWNFLTIYNFLISNG